MERTKFAKGVDCKAKTRYEKVTNLYFFNLSAIPFVLKNENPIRFLSFF